MQIQWIAMANQMEGWKELQTRIPGEPAAPE
jgi:hypothetical protein